MMNKMEKGEKKMHFFILTFLQSFLVKSEQFFLPPIILAVFLSVPK